MDKTPTAGPFPELIRAQAPLTGATLPPDGRKEPTMEYYATASLPSRRWRMHLITRAGIAVIVALASMGWTVLGWASGASAGTSVPFKGTLAAITVSPPERSCPSGTVLFGYSGSGNATELGQYYIEQSHCSDLAAGTFASGESSITAANGDSLNGTYSGHVAPTSDPYLFTIEAVSTFTGGTGRFAGATGTLTIQATFDAATGQVYGTLDGTITSVGSGKE